ncbi:putative sterile alpha motif domain-containing protein [Helianthus annuus]|nr:putative sterile alpha motif domain-containing protein [Helianthus annuus]
MADTSRPQFTITLGRSGQVVKRAGAVVDSDFVGSVPAAGIKRSVRDRLGSNVDAGHLDNKRFRGANGRLSSNASNGVDDDTHLSKHDLRFKIMKKSERKAKLKNVDLRDMLSRKARPSSTNHKVHQSPPEPRNDRPRATRVTPEPKEPKDGQWDPVDGGPRDDRRLMRDPIEVRPRDDRRLVWDSVEVGPRDDRRVIRDPVEVGPRDDRRVIRDPVEVGPRDDQRVMRVPVEVGPRMHHLYDDRQSNLDPTDGSMPSRLTSTRTSRTLSQMDLSKTSFSLETLDRMSRSSQPRVLDNSIGLPPPLTEEPLRRPLMRPVTYASGDVREIARPMATTSFPVKPVISDGPAKSVGLSVAPQLPMGRIVPQSQYPVEYLTVEGFLHSLGLDKYLISFKVEEVDMATLSQMGDHDLKEMGIPMGPRKKILLALLARHRRPAQ